MYFYEISTFWSVYISLSTLLHFANETYLAYILKIKKLQTSGCLILNIFSGNQLNMGYLTVAGVIALLVVIQCTSVSACYYPTQSQSNTGKHIILLKSLQIVGCKFRYYRRHCPSLGKYADYFVGEMSLLDAKGKGKRAAIWPLTPSHSMILFRGKVFEWGINYSYYMGRSPSSCKITWRSTRESYSRCTLSQVEQWTRDYGANNIYNLAFNNCHMFVNRLAKYLYSDCATK